MSSKDTCPFERCNERYSTSLPTADIHMTKHSSSSIISSESILSPNSISTTVQQFSGKELRPRVLQEALSSMKVFIFEINNRNLFTTLYLFT